MKKNYTYPKAEVVTFTFTNSTNNLLSNQVVSLDKDSVGKLGTISVEALKK